MNIDTYLQKLPFYKQRWFQFIYFLVKNFINDDCQQKSSSLTYTTMLSIVPILTVLLVMLSSIPALSDAKQQIQDMIYSNLLPSSSMQVTKYFNEFAEKSSNLTYIGVIMLFVTTIMTLTTIERAFNQIWRVEQKAEGLQSILRYWAIVTLGPLVLGMAFIASSTVQSLSFLNQSIGGYGIDWTRWVQIGSFVMMTLGFVAMYWFVPRCKVKFTYALIAGIFAAVCFEVLKQTFGTIMTNFTSYEKIYGAFAAVPIFLLWIYLSWNVILLGVEISYTLTIFETREVYPRHPLLSVMDMLNVVYQHHLKGEAVNEIDLRNVLGRKEMPHWYRYIRYLQDNNLIAVTDDDKYILKRPLDDYTFWEFYKNLPYPLPHSQDLAQIDKFDPWMQAWVGKLKTSEALLKQNFSIGLAEIFNNMPPRKDPVDEKKSTGMGKKISNISDTFHQNTEKIKAKVGLPDNAVLTTQQINEQKLQDKVGLTGGQVSDLAHDNRTIEDTQTEKELTVKSNQEFLARQSQGYAGSEGENLTVNPNSLPTQTTTSPALKRGLFGLAKFPIITDADKPK